MKTLKLSQDKLALSHVLATWFTDHDTEHHIYTKGITCPFCDALNDLVALKQIWLKDELTKAIATLEVESKSTALEILRARYADVVKGKL